MRSALGACVLVIVMLGFGFAAPAAAIDRLVDDNLVRCVSGPMPLHATISDAVAAAAPGETIGVCPGTYAEVVEVLTDDLVLQAIGLVKVVSPGRPGGGFLVGASGVTVTGFDVSGFTDVDDCGILVAFAVGGDIRNNRVHDNTFGICAFFAEGTKIRNNVIENNSEDAIFAGAFDSIQMFTNTARNNGGFGIWIESCDFVPGLPVTDVHHNSISGNMGDGIYAPDCPAIIQNNTVRNNALAGPDFHGIHIFDSVGAVVTKNIVQSSNVGIFIEEAFDTTVSFNNVTFNAIGIDVFDSDGATLTRNNVSRNTIIDCQWDGLGAQTFTANACGTETPPGAWD